jgi:hypothetical protein
MPIDQVVALLVAERDKLNRAIEALQGPVRRRGRPPKSMIGQVVPGVSTPIKGPKTRTAAQREAQSKRMKLFWAKRRKAS